jgi:outer membrane assembly lipoprotein YfiO
MRRDVLLGALVGSAMLACGGFAAGPAEAAWVWSPQTGWIGPSGAVKDSPEQQLDHALSFFDKADYDKARIEFQKLLKHYKDSPEAPEAQYHIGRCREEKGDYYEAFLAYRKTLQVYPSTARFNEVLERMAQIGNYFLSGKKRRLLGTAALLPARDKAVEIFQAIVQDGPFSQVGELAQYKLGVAHLALGEYEQAVSAFEQLIDRYPSSPLVDDARFQLAQASLKGTFKPGYDPRATDQAIEQLGVFVQEYPTSDLSGEAVARLEVLRERRAEHEFQVAQFYERQKAYQAALVSYRGIVDRYADTSWASKAAARVGALESNVQ